MGKERKKFKNPKLPLLLRQFREKKGWSQEELAEAAGVSDATINRCEKGKQNWTQEFLQNAAKALGCHWLELLPLDRERARARDVLITLGKETEERK